MKKTLLVVAGGAAALSLIGGGTFAAWSDFSVDNASAGAGILELDLVNTSSGAGATEAFGFGNMAPGTSKIQEIYVASSDAESVPNATLSLDLQNLVDTEADGTTPAGRADLCTTNSEAAAEGASCGTEGEFADEAWIQIVAKAAASPASCGSGGFGLVAVGPLATVAGAAASVLDATVAPGEGVCIRIELGLPDGNITPPGIDFQTPASTSATNASQGDRATFDVRFDLVQNVT